MSRTARIARPLGAILALVGILILATACDASEGDAESGDGRSPSVTVEASLPSGSSTAGSRQAETATPTAVLVAPTLTAVDPASLTAAGGTLRLTGSGGYYEVAGRYDESARSFEVWLDGISLGPVLSCYVNHCEAELLLPPNLAPGEHELTTVGGSAIKFSIA